MTHRATEQADATELSEFKARIMAFLSAELDGGLSARNAGVAFSSREDMQKWTSVLSKKGWSVPGWPQEYGGAGWSPLQRHIFEDACFSAGAPRTNVQGISLIGPVIYTFGSIQQKQKYLPKIVSGETIWAQGFSEPESGSDLASLRTTAKRDGSDYIVNGQKIWTTQAHISDMLFCLVRTSHEGKPQRGISLLLIPTSSPGITVRPIRSIDGEAHLCEVFFADVRVPSENLIGEEGSGWNYAKFMLGNERTFLAELPRNKRALALLKAMRRQQNCNIASTGNQTDFDMRLARAEIEFLALERTVLEDITTSISSPLVASIIKIRGTELLQKLSALRLEALGTGAAIECADTNEFFYQRAATIYGGSTEIQKNILSKIILEQANGQRWGADTQDEALLRASAQKFAQQYRKLRQSTHVADAAEMRHTFAKLGWLSMAVPEEAGGMGDSASLRSVVFEEMGRARIDTSPLLANVLASRLILLSPNTQSSAGLLSGLMSGDTSYAIAYDEEAISGVAERIKTQAARHGEMWSLSGRKDFIINATEADSYIVAARTQESDGQAGITLFFVDAGSPGLHIEFHRSVDGRSVGQLHLDRVRLGPERVIGEVGSGLVGLQAGIHHATVSICAEAIGAMEEAFVRTRDYLLIRKQFGRPLAEFQALQHRLADMCTQISQARAAVNVANRALDLRNRDFEDRAVSAAKAAVGNAGKYIGAQAIQLHGGMGMTEECGIGDYFKSLLFAEAIFGNETEHLKKFSLSD